MSVSVELDPAIIKVLNDKKIIGVEQLQASDRASSLTVKTQDANGYTRDYFLKASEKLAQHHRKSKSPNGCFGFHVTTFDGKLPLNTFIIKLLRGVYELDTEINGFWKDLDHVMHIAFSRLISRLLDPLTANGRSIKPCLIHGDLERVDEFDDRSRLYSVETLIINSAHFPGKDTRQLTVKELEYLIKKYLDVD
ncbi:Fructosamine kinase-domain-containing protein [Hypoxylon fragiforme]|uniref:Fructosamine kinase-domain-containing protein n=1 Tax=Hypoxylon fragiforme TaxID=63214 RepID=UPI0020C62B24|nr:Fructosamine kinase-domain-containing protein [Hypoxylon fragiforme]KAI2610351.1 Fructosamine kinase-domain-containing protein [Hypoxylon fragiforme]